MTTNVTVNVSVRKVRKRRKDASYKGKFHFQQVEPLEEIYVKKNGDIHAFKATDDLAIRFNWVSDAVEIDDALYEAYYCTPRNESIWVLPGEDSEPDEGDKAPPDGDHDITVPDGPAKRSLTLKDRNDLDKRYKYSFVVHLEIGGGALLIKDPKIINKTIKPRMAPGKPRHKPIGAPPPGTNANN